MKDTLLVPARYCGPAKSGNGGYVAGALAHELGDTLGRRCPSPCASPLPSTRRMHVNRVDGGLTLTFGGALVAQAEPADQEIEPVEGVSWDEAVRGEPVVPGPSLAPLPAVLLLRHRA